MRPGNNGAQSFAGRAGHGIVDDVDLGIAFDRRLRSARQFICPEDTQAQQKGEEKTKDRLHFPWAAATTFCAASARSSAAMTARPLSAMSFLPALTLVPS